MEGVYACVWSQYHLLSPCRFRSMRRAGYALLARQCKRALSRSSRAAPAVTRQALVVTLPSSRTRWLSSGSAFVDGLSIKGTLGVPLPLDEHAVSVAMPLWSHVVGYEEGDPSVTEKLALGYPRFVYHPFIRQLVQVWKDRAVEEGLVEGHEVVGALPFPSEGAANRCRQFLLDAHSHQPGFPVSVHPIGALDTYIVVFPATAAAEAKAFWQHSGEILSSRKAKAVLCKLGHNCPSITESFIQSMPAAPNNHSITSNNKLRQDIQPGCYRQALRDRIASLTGQSRDQVWLTICGMAAIFQAFQICKQALPNRRVVVFGFSYLDTLKICLRKEWSHGVHFFGRGDAKDMAELEKILEKEQIMGLFTEFPSNPLLQCPDLHRLTELGRRHGFPVVVDDTIANFHNVDLLRRGHGSKGADIVVTSLTKLFSGKGDAMGGSLIINKDSHLAPQLLQAADELSSNQACSADLYEEDARAVYVNGADFEARSATINTTTEALTDWLRKQPGVKEVYYPKTTQPEIYQSFMRPGGGYGGLFTVILENMKAATAFYDALDVYKGPSLGTNFTLACPYTLLAHYNELDFAQQHGVCPTLIRVSVGLEPIEHLKQVFETALVAARKAA